jgi:glycosylphosphatidylinositol transamidase (GPIT) subunit GPI8
VNRAEQVHSICGVLHFAINRTEISSVVTDEISVVQNFHPTQKQIESHKHLYSIVLCRFKNNGVDLDYLGSLTTPESSPH